MNCFYWNTLDFENVEISEEYAGQQQHAKVLSVNVTGLLKSSKKPKPGARLIFTPNLEAELLHTLADGKVCVKLFFDLKCGLNPEDILTASGRIPLPPYIHRDDKDFPEDRERYQTLFARKSGAVAAPTAGLHFSESMLDRTCGQKYQNCSHHPPCRLWHLCACKGQ